MELSALKASLSYRLQAIPRRLRLLRSGRELRQEDVQLTSTVGYQLAARLTRPAGKGPFPGLVISPAIHQGRHGLENPVSPVTVREVASLGYVVLSYDPAGRGESWGEEDFGGAEHQDNLQVAIRHLSTAEGVDGRIGVLSLSLGIAAAVGALADADLGVAWLLDWEGPCDREIITAGGTMMVPAAGHALDDELYWRPREAVRRVGALRCGYVRLQADPDHAQPGELRHAERMTRAASQGTLPWFQLNDHPRGDVPPRPNWFPGGPLSANRVILRKLSALRG